jgi:AraC-like DNA-binding protein
MGVGTQASQLRCGIGRSPAGTREIDFCTPQYALVYIHEGRGWYLDEHTRRRELLPGSFFQRFPSRAHSVGYDVDVVRAWLAVPCQVFELLALMGLAHHAHPVGYAGGRRSVMAEFMSIRDELGASPDRALVDVMMRMQRFLVRLHERARERRTDGTLVGPIERATQLLSQDLARRVRMPGVARAVGMGYAAFRKEFASQVGTPPLDYRIRRRIERAMTMLTQGDALVKEIAAELGYPDEYAFSAQFKKVAGIPPREFRLRNR